MTSVSNWLTAVGTTGATLVALYGALVLPKNEEWRRRRNYSKLGVAIAKSLLEEVKTGRKLMGRMLEWTKGDEVTEKTWPKLPAESWEGMGTMPNDVLLRIIALTDEEMNGDYVDSRQKSPSSDSNSADQPFSPLDIRVHCKNYFAHIVVTINSNAVSKQRTPQTMKDRKASVAQWLKSDHHDFLRDSDKVIAMLEETIRLLTKNAKERRPR